jgi:hypothetical protein
VTLSGFSKNTMPRGPRKWRNLMSNSAADRWIERL